MKLRNVLCLLLLSITTTGKASDLKILEQDQTSLNQVSANKIHGKSFIPLRAKKAWTLLMYIAANNNLHSFALQNLREMVKIGSNEFVNIVIQFDGIEQKKN